MIKENRLLRYVLNPILSLWMALPAFAHSVWIEPDSNGEMVARFGEFGDDPETSPGYLDSLDPVVAWEQTANDEIKPIKVTLKKDGFDLPPSPKGAVQSQTGFPIMTRGSSPARKPHFYARWAPSCGKAAAPAMTLDIVPTGKPGEVRVFFRNKPLPGVELTLYTPEANDQELKSDKDGLVHFTSTEKGLFMLKVGRYREERAGFDRGSLFRLVSHNCSLTWVQS